VAASPDVVVVSPDGTYDSAVNPDYEFDEAEEVGYGSEQLEGGIGTTILSLLAHGTHTQPLPRDPHAPSPFIAGTN
jgi:hypothetical protein